MIERVNAWKKLIIERMIQQIRADEILSVKDRSDIVSKLKGSVGESLAINRIALALGINALQLEKRLIRSVLRKKRPLKPKVVR